MPLPGLTTSAPQDETPPQSPPPAAAALGADQQTPIQPPQQQQAPSPDQAGSDFHPGQALQPGPNEHRGILSDILHAVGDALGGPSTKQSVDPNTGEVTKTPVSTGQRIAGGIARGIVGAGAGMAQHGPGSVGRSVLAGAEAGQSLNRERSANLAQQASLAKGSQDMARIALDMKSKQQEMDEKTVQIANASQELKDIPGAEVVGHFDSNKGINDFLSQLGPDAAGQHAKDLAQNNIKLVLNPKGGFDAISVPKGI